MANHILNNISTDKSLGLMDKDHMKYNSNDIICDFP